MEMCNSTTNKPNPNAGNHIRAGFALQNRHKTNDNFDNKIHPPFVSLNILVSPSLKYSWLCFTKLDICCDSSFCYYTEIK